MDPESQKLLLHQIAQQRCQPLGCQMQKCMRRAKNPTDCQPLMRKLLACKDKELSSIEAYRAQHGHLPQE